MKLISFSGIDGSGKSTLSNRTEAFLRAKGVRAEVVEVYKNSIYITIGRIIGFFSGRTKDGIEKMHSKEGWVGRPALNFVRKTCLLLDILIFRLRLILSYLANKTLVCDRYFFDILVHYVFINVLNESGVRFFLKIIPKPNMAIFLTTDGSIAQIREGDHEDRRYYEQKNDLYKMMAKESGLIIVDSSRDEDRTWIDIEQIIANKKPCRILMVSRAIEPPWDEASKNLVRDIISHLDDYTFHILTTGDDYSWKKNVVEETIYADKALTLRQKVRLFVFLFKHSLEFDLYHFCFTPEFFTSLLLKNMMRNRKSIQNIPYLTERITDRNIKNIVFSDAVVVSSEYTKGILKRNGISNVTLIYPSVDTERFFQRAGVSSPEGKMSLPKGFNVLWPCKFASDAEIKALESIAYETSRLDDNINFVISLRIDGKVNLRRLEALKEILKKRNIEDKVVFIEKVEDMALLMSSCDMLVYPFFAGFKRKIDIPYVVIEAMASAKPILISDKEPINEVIKLGAGMALAKDDAAEFAGIINMLHKNNSLRTELGSKNREVALRYFDLSKNLALYDRIYKDLLKNEPS